MCALFWNLLSQMKLFGGNGNHTDPYRDIQQLHQDHDVVLLYRTSLNGRVPPASEVETEMGFYANMVNSIHRQHREVRCIAYGRNFHEVAVCIDGHSEVLGPAIEDCIAYLQKPHVIFKDTPTRTTQRILDRYPQNPGSPKRAAEQTSGIAEKEK